MFDDVPTATSPQFEVGLRVRLKTGGPALMVTRADGSTVSCLVVDAPVPSQREVKFHTSWLTPDNGQYRHLTSE